MFPSAASVLTPFSSRLTSSRAFPELLVLPAGTSIPLPQRVGAQPHALVGLPGLFAHAHTSTFICRVATRPPDRPVAQAPPPLGRFPF